MAQKMELVINNLKFYFLYVLIILGFNNIIFASESYYKLDDFDSSYNKLNDQDLVPKENKNLHPSSIYKPKKPNRVKKEHDYSRIKIEKNPQLINRFKQSKNNKK